MTLSLKELRTLTHLSRLEYNEQQAQALQSEMARILDFVDQMNQIDTEDTEVMAHPLDIVQVLREDEISETIERDKFQAIAPEVYEGHYLVPKVIE